MSFVAGFFTGVMVTVIVILYLICMDDGGM